VARDSEHPCSRRNSLWIRRAPRLRFLNSRIQASSLLNTFRPGELSGLLLFDAKPASPSARYLLIHFLRVGRETPHRRQASSALPVARKRWTHLSRALTSLSMGKTIGRNGKDVYESHIIGVVVTESCSTTLPRAVTIWQVHGIVGIVRIKTLAVYLRYRALRPSRIASENGVQKAHAGNAAVGAGLLFYCRGEITDVGASIRWSQGSTSGQCKRRGEQRNKRLHSCDRLSFVRCTRPANSDMRSLATFASRTSSC